MSQPLLLGKMFQGLYFADEGLFPHSSVQSHLFNKATLPHASPSVASTVISSKLDEAKLLHLRLGHVPYSKLNTIVPTVDVANLSYCICTICPVARQHRLSFSSSEIKTTKIFELLHIDVWGPFHTSTHDGCKYFLTIMDDYSRATWVHLMKSKLDSVSIIHTFLQFVGNQFHTTVKIIRTHNALELCHGKILTLYHTFGILHQTSCPDTPQQNGVIERKHKHLMETARALFFQSNLPSKYWGDSVQCAAFLINRMPVKQMNNITPHEKLFDTKPDYSLLRCFGCLCFVSTSKQHRTKLEPRANPCVFIGYPAATKGYKVLNLVTNKI